MTTVYKAIANVTAAMAKAGISKDRKNQQQGYSFRGIDDVYNVLSGMLAEYGLCIIPRILTRTCQERATQKGGTLFYVTVEAEYDLVSAEDGSKHTARVFGEAMDSADKATNKAMSAAYKYMAFQTFAIPTEGDNDADAHTPQPAPATPEMFNYEAALDKMADAVSEAQLKAIFAPAWSRAKKDGNKEMMDTLKANYDTFKTKFAANDAPKTARAIVSDVPFDMADKAGEVI